MVKILNRKTYFAKSCENYLVFKPRRSEYVEGGRSGPKTFAKCSLLPQTVKRATQFHTWSKKKDQCVKKIRSSKHDFFGNNDLLNLLPHKPFLPFTYLNEMPSIGICPADCHTNTRCAVSYA